MTGKKVFVTVGTTKFEKLIETASNKDVLDVLHKLGYTFIQYQTGSGRYKQKSHEILTLRFDKYFEDFDKEIEKSDLIISHAGAGTCLQVLKRRKPLVVVINDDLMDNHQVELAEQLQKNEYLYCCTCDNLRHTLLKDFNVLKEYPIPQPKLFTNYLDKCMGFID
ncbi:hypothetical protein ILUMI_12607 [Ignelater luminosus]|uniref:UDP-N-acetylglucosamine transferase subunit ALG13 n=1 Tax=Ignelater luminosus TaxID=2038154 RepID=A0A8K0GCT0_IGNLU|nr:hypothetical protein ILUMI_12607 [Ignelater luminosus]